jgi:hypothetical protein
MRSPLILHWRSGNGNLAPPVINQNLNMLGTGFYDDPPDIWGSWLNTGDAQAQFTWPTLGQPGRWDGGAGCQWQWAHRQ